MIKTCLACGIYYTSSVIFIDSKYRFKLISVCYCSLLFFFCIGLSSLVSLKADLTCWCNFSSSTLGGSHTKV